METVCFSETLASIYDSTRRKTENIIKSLICLLGYIIVFIYLLFQFSKVEADYVIRQLKSSWTQSSSSHQTYEFIVTAHDAVNRL
jgi:hypothetical protein